MTKLIAKVVPDHDGQAVLFPEGHKLLTCDEVVVERQGEALILRPAIGAIKRQTSTREAH